MFIFYDFETSSRSLLGQILSYAFVVVDDGYAVHDQLVGTIALTRTQLPDIGAVLTNRIRLSEHQKQGISEKAAADQIYQFLDRWTNQAVCTLVGYNSNQFDLNFLRNLLIRYGHNPYYYGRLKNKDLLHYSRHLAMQYPNQFRWELGTNVQGKPYWVFTLESMAMRYGVLTDKQAHDALADVHVCLDLIRTLEVLFPSESLQAFQPFNIANSVAGQLVGSRALGTPDTQCVDQWFYVVAVDRRALLLVDLDRYAVTDDPTVIANCSLVYRNPNKHYVQIAPAQIVPDEYQTICRAIQRNPLIQTISIESYLETLENDWDIEHRIYAMGFERIPQLHQMIQTVDRDFSQHATLVQTLMQTPSEKNRYLVQLLNRYYLNYGQSVPDAYFKRYIIPRYGTGGYERNAAEFQSFESRYAELHQLIQDPNPEDLPILNDLKEYYDQFKDRYPYLTQTTTK